jgi:hypothetical protein
MIFTRKRFLIRLTQPKKRTETWKNFKNRLAFLEPAEAFALLLTGFRHSDLLDRTHFLFLAER